MQKGKGLNDFKFGTSIGHFPSDSTASTAVKGLNKGVGGGVSPPNVVGSIVPAVWVEAIVGEAGCGTLLGRKKTVNSYQSTFCLKA